MRRFIFFPVSAPDFDYYIFPFRDYRKKWWIKKCQGWGYFFFLLHLQWHGNRVKLYIVSWQIPLKELIAQVNIGTVVTAHKARSLQPMKRALINSWKKLLIPLVHGCEAQYVFKITVGLLRRSSFGMLRFKTLTGRFDLFVQWILCSQYEFKSFLLVTQFATMLVSNGSSS